MCPDRDQTPNLGASGGLANQLSYLARVVTVHQALRPCKEYNQNPLEKLYYGEIITKIK